MVVIGGAGGVGVGLNVGRVGWMWREWSIVKYGRWGMWHGWLKRWGWDMGVVVVEWWDGVWG